ncbi:cilia- and flagella-associated protein 251-like [Sardina pilchardus]|uniref:cilia- and flagella-associated protein 251-like n=1 Tax=Sardina pilchardus TaxID=27697 RepID=UPI002E167D7B
MDLGLPLSSGCTETHQVDLRVIVKEEDVKEEEYGHMISCPDEGEKPFAELHCKTETDVTESPRSTYNELLETTVKTEVKIEEEEVKKEEEEEEEVNKEEEEEEEEQHEHLSPYNELLQTTVKTEEEEKEEEEEVNKEKEEEEEEEEEQHEHLLESVSDHSYAVQQQIHGQNDGLNLQLQGRLHHCTVCRKSFNTLSELEKHQQTHCPGFTSENPYADTRWRKAS